VSEINYSTINQNFPIAGQDNDTQVFRDNFTAITTALSVAKTEIGTLEGTSGTTNTGAARRYSDNDFNGYEISNAVTRNVTELIIPADASIGTDTLPIEFQTSSYQAFNLAVDVSCSLSQFPADGAAVGKVTLEFYSSDDTLKKVTFSLSGTGATAIKKHGLPALTVSGSHHLEVSSSTNPVIVEIWRHSADNFFLNYVGKFE